MKKYLKLISAGLAFLGCLMMFLPQVMVEWAVSGDKQLLFFNALVGGNYSTRYNTDSFTGVYSGLAGYILLAVGAILIVLCALVPFFKEHDIFSIVVSSAAVICMVVGIILIFLIRRNFSNINGVASAHVYVGAGAIAGGSLGGLGIASGFLSVLLDVAGQN